MRNVRGSGTCVTSARCAWQWDVRDKCEMCVAVGGAWQVRDVRGKWDLRGQWGVCLANALLVRVVPIWARQHALPPKEERVQTERVARRALVGSWSQARSAACLVARRARWSGPSGRRQDCEVGGAGNDAGAVE